MIAWSCHLMNGVYEKRQEVQIAHSFCDVYVWFAPLG